MKKSFKLFLVALCGISLYAGLVKAGQPITLVWEGQVNNNPSMWSGSSAMIKVVAAEASQASRKIILSYSGDVSSISNPIKSVIIPSGKNEAWFYVVSGHPDIYGKRVSVEASCDENRSNVLSIEILVPSRNQNGFVPSEHFTLSPSSNEVLGGNSVTVTLAIPESKKSSEPIFIKLSYNGTGVAFVKEVKEVVMPANQTKVEFAIDVKYIQDDLERQLIISYKGVDDATACSIILLKGEVEQFITLTAKPPLNSESTFLSLTISIPKNKIRDSDIVVRSFPIVGNRWYPYHEARIPAGKTEVECTIDLKNAFNGTYDNEKVLDIVAYSYSRDDRDFYGPSNSLSVTINPLITLSTNKTIINWSDPVSIIVKAIGISPSKVVLSYAVDGAPFIKDAITSSLLAGEVRAVNKGDDEVKFIVPLNNDSDRDRVLQISANGVGFESLNSLSITVLKKPELKLSLNAKEVRGGDTILGEVTIPESYKSSLPITVTLSYTGTGLSFLENPIKSVVILPNETEASIEIVVKNIVGNKNYKPFTLSISSETVGFRPSIISNISLRHNVTDLEKNEVLTLPPAPQLKIVDGAVVSVKEKKIVRSSKQLDGFWITCRLKAILSSSGQEKSISPLKVYDGIEKNDTDGIVSLWIPLKDCPTRYYATAEYREGQRYSLGYNQTENKVHSVETGYTTNSSTSDSNGKSQKKSDKDTSHEDWGVEGKMESTIGLPLLGSTKITVGGNFKKGWSRVSGIDTENSSTLTIGNTSGSSHQVKTSITVTKQGPTTFGFRRIYVLFYPTITYSFGYPNDTNPIDIGKYIEYEDDGNKKSVENYIRYLFEPQQFKSADKHYANRLSNYLEKYEDVLKANPDIQSIGKTIVNYRENIRDISFGSHSLGLFHGEVNYGDPANPIEVSVDQPVDCNFVEAKIHHDFRIGKDHKSISHFSWDLPPSATEFQLEVKKQKEDWSAARHFSGGRVRDDKGFPIKQTYHGPIESYSLSTTYVARVKSKCGPQSDWSAYSNPIIFIYDPAKCFVTGITKTTSGTTHVVSWDYLPGAKSFYVEYATQGRNFNEEKHKDVTWGTVMVDQETALRKNSYTYVGDNILTSIRITPYCEEGKGAPATVNFDKEMPVRCTAIANNLTVTFDEGDSKPVFEWDLPAGGVASLIETKKKSIKSWSRKVKTYMQRRMSRVGDGESIQEESVSIYVPGETYVARVLSQCIEDLKVSSNNWTVPSPEIEFKIPVLKKETSVSANTLSSIGVSSVAENHQLNVGANRWKLTLPELDPELKIAPNPVNDVVSFSVANVRKITDVMEIEIYEISGIGSVRMLHYEKRINVQAGDVLTINKNLPFGNYSLVVLLDGKKSLKKQFIKY